VFTARYGLGSLNKAVWASSVKGYKDEIFISVTFISLVEAQKLLHDICSLSGVFCVSLGAAVLLL